MYFRGLIQNKKRKAYKNVGISLHMDEREIEQAMWGLEGWSLEGDSIMKEYSFDSFSESMEFANTIAMLAEKHEHHPDILVRYDKVTLTLTTHSAGGLTEKDFALAKDIDSSA